MQQNLPYALRDSSRQFDRDGVANLPILTSHAPDELVVDRERLKAGGLPDIDASILRVVEWRDGGGADGGSAIVGQEADVAVLPRSQARGPAPHVRQRIVPPHARQGLLHRHEIPIGVLPMGLRREGGHRNGILRDEHEEARPLLGIAVIASAQAGASDLVSQSKEAPRDGFQISDVLPVEQAHDILEHCRGARCHSDEIDQKEG